MAGPEALSQLLTIDQLAERLGVSIRHIRRRVAERRVPYLKVGWLVRFDPAEITAWLDGARHPQQAIEWARSFPAGVGDFV
ncbi:MAG: helix-turn-helix domain-containing protein [Acidimicrobiales bacterium]|jgi:excisionase family DNA binding protein